MSLTPIRPEGELFPLSLYPDPVLRKRSEPVERFDEDLREFAGRLAATMIAERGIGLAANQVGKAIRVIAVAVEPERAREEGGEGEAAAAAAAAGAGAEGGAVVASAPSPPAPLPRGERGGPAEKLPPPPPPPPPPEVAVLVNPEIVEASGREEAEERCLSLPGEAFQAKVRRATAVRVRYRDLDGSPRELAAKGLLARALQHEVDHVNGVLFVDRASFAKRLSLRKHLSALKATSRPPVTA